MTVFILAAGKGTRLGSLTDSLPKALVPLGETVMLDALIKRLARFGVTNIILNAHHAADKLARHVREASYPAPVTVVEETSLLGTGGAIRNAAPYFPQGEPVLVHNVDILSDIDLDALWKAHADADALVTLAVNRRETDRPILVTDDMRFAGKAAWIPENEHGAFRKVGYTGIQVISPGVLRFFHTGAYDVFECYRHVLEGGETIAVHDIGDAFWIDLGTVENLRKGIKWLESTRRSIA